MKSTLNVDSNIEIYERNIEIEVET